MKRRPKVEAWTAVFGAKIDGLHRTKADAEAEAKRGAGFVVRLVPADPDREAVVRAAVWWRKGKISDDELLEAVDAYLQPAAVEKLQRKGRKP